MNNPFALVVLAAQKALLANKTPEQVLNDSRLTIARTLVQGGQLSHPKILNFIYFLKNFLHINNEELNANFDQQTEILTGKRNAMGIIETIKMLEREEGIEVGREKGFEEKTYDFVKKLLLETDFKVAKIASLADTTPAFVNKVKKGLK